MKIIGLEADGFRGLKAVEMEFTPQGLIPIYGKNKQGKCHAKGTRILMFDGTTKNVEDIEIGDFVMGDDGTSRKVLETARGNGDLFEVEIRRTKEKFVVNGNHILPLRKDGGDKKNITVYEYLEQHKTFKQHYHLRRTSGVPFIPKDISIEPYFLGLWLGDGHSSHVSITTQDGEIINYLVGYSKRLGLNFKRTKVRNRCAAYSITNNRKDAHRFSLTKLLKGYGLINNKHIPFDFLTNSRENRLELLAGLIDSDGYINDKEKNNPSYVFSNNNKLLCEQIMYLSRSLGFSAYLRERIARIKSIGYECITYRVYINGKKISSIPVRIKRKKIQPKKRGRDVLSVGFHIRNVGVGEFYGFTLDGNHLYLLDNFIVQHNTSILDFILWMIYGNKELNPEIIGKDKDRIKGILKLDKYEIVREFPRKGTPKLKVKNTETGKYEEGEVQNFLNTFINKLTIDTRPFLDETAIGKLKYLLDLLGIDFTDINNKIKTLEQDRLIAGREFDKFGDLDEDMPEKIGRVDADKLFKKRKALEEINNELAAEFSVKEHDELLKIEIFNKDQRSKARAIDDEDKISVDLFQRIVNQEKLVEDLKKQLEKAIADKNILHTSYDTSQEKLSKLPKPEPEKPLTVNLEKPEYQSTENIDKQIQDVNATNVKADLYDKWIEKKSEKEGKGKEYEGYDRQVKEQREKKLEILRKAKHGVKGLEIREDGLYYNDNFSENWSDAESIRIISELALSRLDREKQIEALFLDRFESFDEDMRADLEKMCEEVGIQTIVTIVRNSTKEVDEDGAYFFIEDGKVERHLEERDE